jgi:integrase/recombinase XerD
MQNNLSKLRAVLFFLRKRGFNVIDPREIELPTVKPKTPVFLDYSEVQSIIDVATSIRDKAIVSCLFSTGCRISELMNLNIDDVTGQEVVVLGKGSKYRTVYMDDKAWGFLTEYLSSRCDKLPPLFVSGQYRRLTVSRVQQILHCLESAAGVEKNVTPHVFRHTFATDLIRNGAHILSVKEMLGHANLSTTQIYTHVTNPQLQSDHRKYHSS